VPQKSSTDSFIMDFWEQIFSILSKISIFYLIRKLKSNISYRFVECWVLFNLVFSILSSLIVYYFNFKPLIYIIFSYAVIRVFEVIIYQLNVLLFDPYRAEKKGKQYKIKSASRMVLLLLHNYVEIMFWYATMMLSLKVLVNVELTQTLPHYIRASILCIATLDKSPLLELVDSNIYFLSNLAFFQVLSGLIMTLISIARFINILPEVEQIDKF